MWPRKESLPLPPSNIYVVSRVKCNYIPRSLRRVAHQQPSLCRHLGREALAGRASELRSGKEGGKNEGDGGQEGKKGGSEEARDRERERAKGSLFLYSCTSHTHPRPQPVLPSLPRDQGSRHPSFTSMYVNLVAGLHCPPTSSYHSWHKRIHHWPSPVFTQFLWANT